MQSRKLTYILKAVDGLDITWQAFMAEIKATEPQSHNGRPTVAEAKRWQKRIVRWCNAIDRIKAGLDEIRTRICDDVIDEETENGAPSAE